MIYKKIFFTLFLILHTIFANIYGNVQIRELQNKLSTKEMELAQLTTEITEKESLLHSLLSIGSEIYRSILFDLDHDEQAEFKKTIKKLEESIEAVLQLKEHINATSIQQSIIISAGSHNKIEKFKSLVILRSIENFFLKKLFQSLAERLQEISDLGQELNNVRDTISL